jgi:general stress protein YciG
MLRHLKELEVKGGKESLGNENFQNDTEVNSLEITLKE